MRPSALFLQQPLLAALRPLRKFARSRKLANPKLSTRRGVELGLITASGCVTKCQAGKIERRGGETRQTAQGAISPNQAPLYPPPHKNAYAARTTADPPTRRATLSRRRRNGRPREVPKPAGGRRPPQ